MRRSYLQPFRSLALNRPTQCQICQQFRPFHAFRPLLAEPQPDKPTPQKASAFESFTAESRDLRAKHKDTRDPNTWKPQPLGRPIGFTTRPEPFHNLERDMRSWSQWQHDLLSVDKHRERSRQLKEDLSRPYFKDWTAMKYAQGKIFVANPKVFKKESALFFPNFWGHKLDWTEAETVTTMRGKISVVCVFSKAWAERQCGTYTSEAENPELWQLFREHEDRVQMVEINVEEDSRLSRAILWAFASNIRKKKTEPWQKYFVLRRIRENLRQVLGMINRKSGYVYLVDSDCKVRWAGSGDAWEGEKESLVAGVKRLLQQEKQAAAEKAAPTGAVRASKASSAL
jgi:mitochondrial ATPase complex subunit ATP10